MEDIWRDVKLGAEALWVSFLGAVGALAHNWDTIVSKLAAFTALVILLNTAWRRFFKKVKPAVVQQEKDEYEGD